MKRLIAGLAVGALLTLAAANAYADEPEPTLTPGVTVTANPDSATGYTATFVFEDADPGLTRVMLYSDTFLLWDEQAPQYINGQGMNLNNVSAEHKAAFGHLPGDYAPSYWPGGGSGSSRYTAELTKVEGTDFWVTTADLSSGAFVYNYEVTRNGVTTARLDDPANPALRNTATGIRSLSSLVYVPYDAQKQGTGAYRDRSLELPRTDGRRGTVETITYPSAEGTDRGMSVYLPYGYDPDRAEPYKVLYINMGNSGDQVGNELRWMNEGALPNIVDNLVADHGKEPFVAVSVNYQDWGHSFTRIQPDVLNNILPFVQANYNVASSREGRAYAGLSAGAGTTARFYLNNPDVFSSFGIWSNGVTPDAAQLQNIAAYKDSTRVHIALGKWDYVTGGRNMSSVLTANGIPHAFNEIPGGHDWEFWQLMLAEFASDYLWVFPPAAVAQPGIGVASAGVNVTWKAPADSGSSPVSGYTVTLTSESGETRSVDVAGDKTATTFTGVPAGRWTATVVATSDDGASAPSAASATAVVTGGQPVRVAASAKSQCVNGTAHVAVYAYNDSGRNADVRLSVLGVDKKQSGVAQGKAVYNLVPSGAKSVSAGNASVTAYSYVDGVGYHSTYTVPYAAIACG